MCSFGTILRPELDADLRRVAVQMRHDHRANDFHVFRFFLDDAFQPAGERADHAIGQQHAQKRAGQRAADHGAEDGGRLVDMRHRLDHAQNGGDDAQVPADRPPWSATHAPDAVPRSASSSVPAP